MVSQNDPKFIGDRISAKIGQKIIILSATWFRRKSEEGSDAAELIEDNQNWFQIATTVQQHDSLFNSSNQILQVHRVDQTLLPAQVDSFVGCSLHCALHPPANVKRFPANVKRLESKKFYICSDVTHTHTPPAHDSDQEQVNMG